MTTPSVSISPPDMLGRACPAASPDADVDLPNLLRARTGDQAAFAPLWDKYWRSLSAYFARRIHDRDEAEDLASETLLAAFDQIPAFRGLAAQDTDEADRPRRRDDPDLRARHCSFQTFLYAIARHKLSHWIRRKVNRPCCDFTDLETSAAEDEGGHSWEERLGTDVESDPLRTLMRQDHLDEACLALADVGMRSSEQFKALFFHYFCELPHKEVATLLDTRSETVNTRLQEGRRTLTRHYQRALQTNTASSC
jgi:RNA polymerase sigma factor (sigma-70 family)